MTKKPKHTLMWRILGACAIFVVIVLIVLRLYLGVWLLDYVNNVLANIKGYQGSVASIDIDLYRGAYCLNHLTLNKKNGNIPAPFLAVDRADLSIQWAALLHGRIVSSVTLTHPTITFAVGKMAEQTGADVDWTRPIKDLTPIDINYVRIEDGSVAYRDFSSTPQVDIYIRHMNGDVKNLRNIEANSDPLPSSLDFHGDSIGHGTLKISGHMNILRKIPDMDILMALENVDLPAINNYTEAYGAFNFKSGNLNFYAQFAVKNNRVSGYIKPIVTHLSVDVLKPDNPLEILWSTIVAGLLEIFTNHAKDQFATRVDLEGDLGNVDASPWSAVGGIIHNAFISAMSKGFDQTGTQAPQK